MRSARHGVLVLAALLGACSPIVGAECRAGLAQCGGECVDLERDARHCGGCGLGCGAAEQCVRGACVGDGTWLGDAGAGDASVEPTDAGGAPDGASAPDGGPPEGCDLGELRCDDACVRPDSDPRHCGGCGLECASGEVCAAGSCADACGAPRATCDDRCVDLRTDPDHCGGCGVRCDSGVCSAGACASHVAGHVVVIGHDYRESRPGMSRVAGNAVFLGRGAPVRVLAFEGYASDASIEGTDAAIAQVASATGRAWTRAAASAAEDVPVALASADVLVVYAQESATDEELEGWGEAWGRALRTFLATGGVVVVFDGLGAHRGTYQVLEAGGFFEAAGRADASDRILTVAAPADAVALGVPLRYRGERATVRFDTNDGVAVVTDGVGPVVVHRTFAP